MTIEKRCIVCGEPKSLTIPDEAYAAWQAGALIQNAMPMLDANDNERDTLANLGMCEDDFR